MQEHRKPVSVRVAAWLRRGAAAILALILILGRSQPVAAGTPHYSHSWYVSDASSSVMYDLGATDGARDSTYCTDAIVILDFGQPGRSSGSYDGYGTYLLKKPYYYVNDSEIYAAVTAYLDGWYYNSNSCPRLHLSIGTNNYNECPHGGTCSIATAGTEWASLLNNVVAFNSSAGFSWQTTIWSADDIETGWDTFAKTRPFVDSFNAAGPQGELIDDGDAWPNQDWTEAHVYYVAYMKTADWPLPEIYNQAAADRWTDVRLHYTMYFRGVTSTGGGYLPPATAWNTFYNDLASHNVGQGLEFLTYIQYS